MKTWNKYWDGYRENNLSFRYDNALESLGKNLDEIKPGEIKFYIDYNKLKILLKFGGVTDIFNISPLMSNKTPYDHIELFFKNQSIIDNICNFFDKKFLHNFTILCQDEPMPKKHITMVKCLVKSKMVNIPVFCPIKYEQTAWFKEQWYRKQKHYEYEK